ncbi:hypothetical protein [Clostridium estertheticum]|uniref:hypothetical protein n=1 Tax=Clostridium estertheticum TaxID=238834 RepID=UPI001CF1CB56|nr:hypothetical protein [Clostridium estertheticum]MCB2361172.1 hypothetical protein [Clostridium estertheticum]
MKKKNNIELILFILSIPLLLFLSFYFSNTMENRTPPYSVVNKSKMGYSVFYESLSKLNYPASRTLKQVGEHQTNTIQLISSGGKFNINDQEVKKWVGNGGMLVYLTPVSVNNIQYATLTKSKGDINLYKYKKGIIINADADYITNGKLIKDTSKAYELLNQISDTSYKKIYFNEFYLFSAVSTKSLWNSIPLELKYIIYQILIALCAFFYCKGKRFGKIIPLYDEVERNENEYLYSAASLYRQARCFDIMVLEYYNNFLKEFKCNEKDWLEYWDTEKISSLNKAKKVYEFMAHKKKKTKPKEYIQIVNMIEQLNKILVKRRELHWKTLKKTLH